MTPLRLLTGAVLLLMLTTVSAGCGAFSATPKASHTWQAPPVLIELTEFPGLSPDTYLAVPRLVVYADGRVIVTRRSEYPHNVAMSQGKLSTAQVCSLLSEIEEDGFFDLSVDDYHSVRDYFEPQVTDHNTTSIAVMGWRTQRVSAYALDIATQRGLLSNNLGARVPAALEKTFLRLRDYRPSGLTEYLPESIALRISDPYPPNPELPRWPVKSLSLAEIAQRRTGMWGTAFLEGQDARAVLDALGDKWRDGRFAEDGYSYGLIAFPLLPFQIMDPNDRYPNAYSYPLTPTVELQCDSP